MVLYFSLSDYPTKPDFFYSFGKFLLFRSPYFKFFNIYLASIAVRAFFLPLMVSFCYQNLAEFNTVIHNTDSNNPFSVVHFLTALAFYLDVSVVVPAYLFASAFSDSSVRSVDTSALGIVVALLCYPPFNQSLTSQLFPYNDSIYWQDAIPHQGFVFGFWISAMVGCLIMYAWASIAMGFRFANLMYKGLVDWGPYKYFRHPAYFFKNIYWWLYSVPFIAATPAEAFKNTLFLAAISCIYYMRAKTEERHLLRFAEYAAYHAAFESSSSRSAAAEAPQ